MSDDSQGTTRHRAEPQLELSVLEDLRALNDLVQVGAPTNAQIRQSSALVRRLLINRDIMKVANGRVGRLMLQAPDNDALFDHTSRDLSCAFLLSGGAPVFGVEMRAQGVHRGARPAPFKFDPEATVSLTLTKWCQQGVIFYRAFALPGLPVPRGTWVTREQVIKYVANVAHGVHAGAARESYELLLSQVRNIVQLSNSNGMCSIGMNLKSLNRPDETFVHRPGHLDPVLWEFFCAIRHLVKSPDVVKLIDSFAHEYPA